MNQLKLFEGFKVQRSVVALDKPEEVDAIDEDGNPAAYGYASRLHVEYDVDIVGIMHGAKGDDLGHAIDDFLRKHLTKTVAGSTVATLTMTKEQKDAEWEAQRPKEPVGAVA